MIINMHITHSLESNLISNGEEYYPMTVISRSGDFNTKTVVIQNVSAVREYWIAYHSSPVYLNCLWMIFFILFWQRMYGYKT